MDYQKTFKTNKFIIATGSSSFNPLIKGIAQVDYITNIGPLKLKNLPNSMIILGGEPMVVEFAQLFSRPLIYNYV